jgi:hypothetical protein
MEVSGLRVQQVQSAAQEGRINTGCCQLLQDFVISLPNGAITILLKG